MTCSDTMKTMTVANSVIIATALTLLQFGCSDADICSAGERSEEDKEMCPRNIMVTSKGDLDCRETVCHDSPDYDLFNNCELSSGNNAYNTLINFRTQMCVTNSSLPSVGFKFRWTLPVGPAEVTGLNIRVQHLDYHPKSILLNVDLSGHVDSENGKNFTTNCLASEELSHGKVYHVSVQVLPGRELYTFPAPFSYNPDCGNPTFSKRVMCGAPPLKRPSTESFCNGRVVITANSGFPPGVTEETTEYRIKVLLTDLENSLNSFSDVKTVPVNYASTEESKVTFDGVKPGIYQAEMGFLNDKGQTCMENVYGQKGNTTVNAPPEVLLESKSFCNGSVEVTVFVITFKRTLDHQFNITVILSDTDGSEGQVLAKTVLVTTGDDSTKGMQKVCFKKVPYGNYSITTKFADDYYASCSSDVVKYELVGGGCSASTLGTPPTVGEFWDEYGKFILGVGVLSVFAAVVLFFVHQRWLLSRRRISEQQITLTEDHGSSADHLSSIADTTVQECHLHRFLNDTSQGWQYQPDCINTDLRYHHQPMSDDSGVPYEEGDSQSWQEDQSIAFSV